MKTVLCKNIFLLFLIALPQNNYCVLPQASGKKINNKVVFGSVATLVCILIAFFVYKNYKNNQKKKRQDLFNKSDEKNIGIEDNKANIIEDKIENNNSNTVENKENNKNNDLVVENSDATIPTRHFVKTFENEKTNVEKKIDDQFEQLNNVANKLGIGLGDEQVVEVKNENIQPIEDKNNQEDDSEKKFEEFKRKLNSKKKDTDKKIEELEDDKPKEVKNQPIPKEEDVDKKTDEVKNDASKASNDGLNEPANKNNEKKTSNDLIKQEANIENNSVDEGIKKLDEALAIFCDNKECYDRILKVFQKLPNVLGHNVVPPDFVSIIQERFDKTLALKAQFNIFLYALGYQDPVNCFINFIFKTSFNYFYDNIDQFIENNDKKDTLYHTIIGKATGHWENVGALFMNFGQKAPLNSLNIKQESPLFNAVSNKKNGAYLACKLLENGCNSFEKNHEGKTPFDYVFTQQDSIENKITLMWYFLNCSTISKGELGRYSPLHERSQLVKDQIKKKFDVFQTKEKEVICSHFNDIETIYTHYYQEACKEGFQPWSSVMCSSYVESYWILFGTCYLIEGREPLVDRFPIYTSAFIINKKVKYIFNEIKGR